ncbi:DUF4168 domain-containing protein [Hyphococcus luteus]|uniref:DUF4168 domain-containing protein n=1 Tax=Hyphococcus luteus TaxID=2058213 RepID=A0A2S7JZQ0_9PROT|nr:DUF4168 domain-containing protein [Marinicaulis flavus]PQA85688.1 hypothetical protein CW354_22440 [Marinicaulis flavus]
MNCFKMTKLLAAAAAAAAASAGPAAMAQDAAAQQQQIAPVSDKEVKKFVKAEKKIGAIVEEWSPKVQSAESQQEAQQMQKKAQTQMIAAIEKEGLSVQRYNQIAQRAQVDKQLAERLQEAA